MWLAARWAKAQVSPPRISVLTVDHGYRSNSAKEARQVSEWAAALGLPCHVLAGPGGKPSSGLQEKARALRYGLLWRWCKGNAASALVTAHTLDDQAETLLMRLARGSGVSGLGAIPAHAVGPEGLAIERPLLGVPRSRLRATLLAAGHGWIEDPSNEDPQFERVRLRKAMPLLAELGLTSQALARSASRLARAAQPLASLTHDVLHQAVTVQPQGYAVIDRSKFMLAEAEIRILALQKLLAMIGGVETAPRLMAVERLDLWLTGEQGDARTLAGCRIARRAKTLIIGREPGRIAREPIVLPLDEMVVWDRRFAIQWPAAPAGSVILPAGEFAEMERKTEIPAFVQASLPVISVDRRLVAAPFGSPELDGLSCRFVHL
jgi:tRNA(Ile)-lysidine synthase